MVDIHNLLSVGRAGAQTTRCSTKFVEPPSSLAILKSAQKLSKKSPTALIIDTVLIDISIYSLVVLVFVCITYSAWFGVTKSGL